MCPEGPDTYSGRRQQEDQSHIYILYPLLGLQLDRENWFRLGKKKQFALSVVALFLPDGGKRGLCPPSCLLTPYSAITEDE